MSSSLSAGSKRFRSKLTTLETLHALPVPEALGDRHRPVPHGVLVDAIHNEVSLRGYIIEREKLALGKNGAALFGVIDIGQTVPAIDAKVPAIDVNGDRGMSFGFRNATDRSMAIRGVAGAHVFVCDNLTMSGDMFAMSRKNTTGLDLRDAIAQGFDKFLKQSRVLNDEIGRLQDYVLNDVAAKALIFDVFSAGIVPVRLFDDVDQFYFRPDEAMTDCQPRSAWGVMNAFTRALKDLSPSRMFNATVALGRQFANA